jgi:hypothetical protein
MKNVVVDPKTGWYKYFCAQVPYKQCVPEPVSHKSFCKYLKGKKNEEKPE